MFKLSFPQTKFWLFSRKSNNFSQKGIHTMKPLGGCPVVEMPPKPELTEDQRKQTVSRLLLLLVKEDTLTVKLNWRALIYIS
jgi:hypothetical protein